MQKGSTVSITIQGILRSYSQIFFSENNWFAIPLVLVSFLDFSAGLCGLIAVIVANSAASFLKFDKATLSKGFYGYNSLLVGLGLGYYYELTLVILAIAIFAGFFTLLISIAFQGILGKYYLPNLSIPFVLSIWIVLNASWMISGAEFNQSGVYILNKLFSIGGQPFVELHQWWIKNITSNFLNSYLQSLGAIFFQFNVFAGIVVAVALLFYSRIAFLLSIAGYAMAYWAYTFLGMDMNQLGYTYIGFNFILGAIAIGGYFYVPSKFSFLWAIAVTPIIAFVAAGLTGILKTFNLPILALPFNIVLLVMMYSLRFRLSHNRFREVVVQEGTPEKNLYSFQSFSKRFPNYGWLQIKLPFFGEWTVSQGHDGEHTHKGEWGQAWDFVIVDSESRQFKDDGNYLKDYYCYGQNVIAPADGLVVEVDDGIADNNVGEVNTSKNWGNTIIIKHAEGLYSKLSHLQKGSIGVKVGENVRFGQVIGKVGNSGRSPYPHLHFQLQSTPYIGSKTMKYPLFAFVENGKQLKTFDYPENGQKVKSIEGDSILINAFNLTPGRKMNWQVSTEEGFQTVSWEVFTNVYNKSYIHCYETKSVAYFQNDGVYFYFTHFEGDRDSLLYLFYLAAFRVPLVYIDGFVSIDNLPANRTFKGWRLFLHDFTAPFYIYLKARTEVSMERSGSEFDTNEIIYNSTLTGFSNNNLVWRMQYSITIKKDGIIRIEDINSEIVAVCEAH